MEIILVDDGSLDQSGDICDELQKQDKRIHVIHQDNRGVSVARNAGIDFSHGSYIAFVDSDDYIESKMYEIMLETIIHDNVDISVCQWQYETADGKHVVSLDRVSSNLYGRKDAIDFAYFLYGGSYENGTVVCACNKLYKRKIFDHLRFEGRFAEDDRFHSVVLSKKLYEALLKSEAPLRLVELAEEQHRLLAA